VAQAAARQDRPHRAGHAAPRPPHQGPSPRSRPRDLSPPGRCPSGEWHWMHTPRSARPERCGRSGADLNSI
jgi:hypothetical protein